MKIIGYIFLLLSSLGLSACQTVPNTETTASSNQSTINTGYVSEEITITSPNSELWGQVYRPNDNEEHPLVIYSHGLGSSYRYGIPYAESLAAQGYVVYTFDFYGGSYDSKSGGEMTDMTIYTEIADLNSVIDYSKEVSYVDDSQVFLIGASQGGVVSALTAAERKDIDGLLLYYPAFVLADEMRSLFDTEADIPNRFDLMGMTLGHDYAASVLDLDILTEATNYDGHVVIFHGTSDNIAPISYSQQAAAAYPHATLVSFDKVGHGFYGDTEQEVIKESLDFLEQQR